MNKAKKVVASGGKVGKVGSIRSRSAVSLCGHFTIEGESNNPVSAKRKALLTLKDLVSGRITGMCISYYYICVI